MNTQRNLISACNVESSNEKSGHKQPREVDNKRSNTIKQSLNQLNSKEIDDSFEEEEMEMTIMKDDPKHDKHFKKDPTMEDKALDKMKEKVPEEYHGYLTFGKKAMMDPKLLIKQEGLKIAEPYVPEEYKDKFKLA